MLGIKHEVTATACRARSPGAGILAKMLFGVFLFGQVASPAWASKDELVVVAPLLMQRFDPTQMVALTEHLVDDMIYDGLLNNGPEGKVPALATSWTISADGKQFDFKLRENVAFHNGDPFTAEDVKFTYDKLLKPDNSHMYGKAFADAIERVEIVGPHQVRFVLKQPWLSFFSTSRYALQYIVPKKYYEQVGAKGFQEKPVGTGPYKLVNVVAGEANRFEAYQAYWGGAPHVRYVTQRLVKEPFTRYAMLRKGEANIVTGLTGPLLEKIIEDRDVNVLAAKYSGTSMLFFNYEKFPEARDKRVREAIGYAIDRKSLSENLLKGACTPSEDVFTPATSGYVPNLASFPYDPAKAKDLLRQAGIPAGKEVTFAINLQASSLPSAPELLEAIAGAIEEVGFKVKREISDSAAWLAMMRAGKQPGIFFGTSAMPDDGGALIGTWYTTKSPITAGKVSDPDIDRVYDDQLKATDPQKRDALLNRFVHLVHERRTSIPLFWCSESFATGKNVTNFQPGIGSPYHLRYETIKLVE